jgi:hypothetical protein
MPHCNRAGRCWQNPRNRPSKHERQIYKVQLERRPGTDRSQGEATKDCRVNKKPETMPPEPTLSADPDRDLERQLSRHPDDADTKVDVGSDESMDASDPSAAAQPGCDNEPAPSSGFPE